MHKKKPPVYPYYSVGCNVRVVHDLYIILSVLLCCLKVAKCGEKKELHVRKLLHTHTCPSLSEIAKQQVMAKAMQKSRSSHTFLSAMDTLICILNILTSKDVQFLASFYFYTAFSTCLFCLLIICPIFLQEKRSLGDQNQPFHYFIDPCSKLIVFLN